MKTSLVGLLMVSAVLAASPCSAASEKKVYECRRLKTKPVLDGRIDNDPAWKNVAEVAGFYKLRTRSPAVRKSAFKMGYTEEGLYVAVWCGEPEMAKLRAKLGDREIFFKEDCVEVFLLPKGAHTHRQFVVNAIGSRWNGLGPERAIRRRLWDWQAKTYKGKDFWSVEIMFPFITLLPVPSAGEEWTGNVCRDSLTVDDVTDRYSSWAPVEVWFHEPYSFARIIFKDPITPKEVTETEKALIARYLKHNVKETRKQIAKWRKQDRRFYKQSLKPRLAGWKKTKKQLSDLNSLSGTEVHQLWERTRRFGDLPLEKLRAEFLRDGLFAVD